MCPSSASLYTELATVGEGGEVLSLLDSDVEGELDSQGEEEKSIALLTAHKSCSISVSPEEVGVDLPTAALGMLCTDLLTVRKAELTFVLIDISLTSPTSTRARSFMAFLSILPVEVLGTASRKTIPPFSCL